MAAIATGRIVGVVVFQTDIEDLPLPSMTILSLGVAHDMRRKGIGTDLKQSVMAEAESLGRFLVVSEVHRANTAMLALNAKLGVGRADLLTPDEYYPHLVVVARIPLRLRLRKRRSRQRG